MPSPPSPPTSRASPPWMLAPTAVPPCGPGRAVLWSMCEDMADAARAEYYDGPRPPATPHVPCEFEGSSHRSAFT
eukprot:7381258-Prymnesium_polylepis.1